jgi:hypothetical protein
MCRIVGRVPELAEDRGPTGLVLSMIEQLTSQTLFAQVKLACQVAALTSELRRLLEPATVELKLGGVQQGSHPVVRGTIGKEDRKRPFKLRKREVRSNLLVQEMREAGAMPGRVPGVSKPFFDVERLVEACARPVQTAGLQENRCPVSQGNSSGMIASQLPAAFEIVQIVP